jgi:hypothetical protein
MLEEISDFGVFFELAASIGNTSHEVDNFTSHRTVCYEYPSLVE